MRFEFEGLPFQASCCLPFGCFAIDMVIQRVFIPNPKLCAPKIQDSTESCAAEELSDVKSLKQELRSASQSKSKVV